MPSTNPPSGSVLDLKLPPVLIGLITAALQWALARWIFAGVPALVLSIPSGRFLAAFLVLLGSFIAAYGVISFSLASTTVNPHTPHLSTSLVCSGLYSRTRNPMYLGMAVVLTGWAVYLSNIATFVGIPLFIAYMNTFQIKPEEKQLRELFADEFDRYCSKTRRWM